MAANRSPFGLAPAAQPLAIFGAVAAAAAVFYSFHLGRDPLGASEAYSAYAAARPNLGAIVRIPILDDPGKQLLYYVVLHYWTAIFGASEAMLRAPSVIFGLGAIAMLFVLGRDLFDDATGASAAALWAFNPIATVFAFRARMYTMLIAIALAHLCAFRRARETGTSGWTLMCAVTGAAIIYTHLGGAALLFAPYLPIASAQSRVLIAGHWLDWIGPAYHYSPATKLIVAVGVAALGLWMIFGGKRDPLAPEPIRFCVLWIAIPIISFAAGSIVVRPMFQLRYVSPSLAMLCVLVAALFAKAGAWTRNIAVVAITATMLAMALAVRPAIQPWGAAARMIADSGDRADPIFFESGFVSSGPALKIPNRGFPHGYYSLPFDYYFHGPNPRMTIAPSDPAAARAAIESAAARTGGAWLISWENASEAARELPGSPHFIVTLRLRGERVAIYRITSAPKS